MGINLMIFSLVFSINSLIAAELKISSGEVNGNCKVSLKDLQKKAQDQATLKAGTGYIRISKWHQMAYTIGRDYEPEVCARRGAWAEAIFVYEKAKNEPLFLTVNLGILNHRKNNENSDEHILTDNEAWDKAVEVNRDYTLKFCKEVINPKVKSKTKKLYNTIVWYDDYSVEVQFQCIPESLFFGKF